MNSEDHPRACGEKSFAVVNGVQNSGSPPRMRGKGLTTERRAGGCRITPAYAGKSKLSPNCIVVKRDHPRICGEKSQHIGARYIPKGSPPHMRGKASCLYFRVPLTGITPAYAGKSYRERYGHHQGRDHPRICGEKSTRKRRTDSTLGSPPHMRGKVLSFVFRLNRDGITPAYAGKSGWWPPVPCRCGDHPRICGEKQQHCASWLWMLGSPPHMRGKVSSPIGRQMLDGITPAYAGKRSGVLMR